MRSQHSRCNGAQRHVRKDVGDLFPLLQTSSYVALFLVWNCVYEKKHYNRFLTGKIPRDRRSRHHENDPELSGTFIRGGLYRGARKDPPLQAYRKAVIALASVHVSQRDGSRRVRISRERGSPAEPTEMRASGESDGRVGMASSSPTIEDPGSKSLLRSSTQSTKSRGQPCAFLYTVRVPRKTPQGIMRASLKR